MKHLSLFVFSSTLLLGGCHRATAASPTPARPNILFVLADDLDRVTFEHSEGLRPLLQDAGTTFDQNFVSISLCCPSRATLLRGQYAHNTGILHNFPPDGGFRGFRDKGCEASTIATWLQAGGYRTGLFGKYLNGYPDVELEYVPPGWDTWFAPVRGGAYRSFRYSVNHNGVIQQHGAKPKDHVTDVLTRAATSFVTQALTDQQPFFAYVSLYAPHLPADPPPRYAGVYAGDTAPRGLAWDEADMTDKPAFQNNPPLSESWVAEIDRAWRNRRESMLGVTDSVARLIAAVEAGGGLDNTWIIFASDNGFHYGDHRLPWGKNTPFDTDLRVPLVVRGPGVPAGGRVSQIVLNTDLAPTFAEIAGIPFPDFVDGRSWLSLAQGQTPAVWRQGFLIEHRSRAEAAALGRVEAAAGRQAPTVSTSAKTKSEPATSVEEGADPTVREIDEPSDLSHLAVAPTDLREYDKEWPSYVGLRSADHTYVRYADGTRELYDHHADPGELNNLAGSADPALILALDGWTDQLRSCAGPACRTAEDAGLGQPR